MTRAGPGASLALLIVASMTFVACGSGAASPAATPGRSTASTDASPTSPPLSSLVPTETSGAPELEVVSDDTGAISIAVPEGWSVVSVRWYHGDEDRGPGIVASPDPQAFAAAFDGGTGSEPRWGLEGIFVGVSRDLADELELGDTYRSAIVALAKWHGGAEEAERGWNGRCLRGGASSYEAQDDGGASGFVTSWQDCGGVGTLLLDLGATGRKGGYVAQALVVMPDGDVATERASSILDSLSIDEAALKG